jgi:hypothetical protein
MMKGIGKIKKKILGEEMTNVILRQAQDEVPNVLKDAIMVSPSNHEL